MCLDHHPGFYSGGTLWFQNLIEYPHGALGLLFPFCIAGLHVVNVQLSFAKSPLQQLPGSLGSLAKGYKNYLLILTLPLLTATFSIPQLSSLAFKQYIDFDTGREDIAIICLRLALEKDPGFVKAMLILGQTLLKNKQFVEAAELFETAISKLLVDGDPTEVEDIDLLILVSQWAGIANVQQGKMEQGLVHLERIARIKEPEDSKSKAHYYDGFLVLSSALANVGREDEALKYLQMAAAYDPSYSVYIEHLKNDSEKPSKQQLLPLPRRKRRLTRSLELRQRQPSLGFLSKNEICTQTATIGVITPLGDRRSFTGTHLSLAAPFLDDSQLSPLLFSRPNSFFRFKLLSPCSILITMLLACRVPPPIPPPLSGRSFRDQFALFWKEKEAADCPSVFWFFSSVAVQVPCFFLWLMSVRKMSLDHHPGFDTGGMLWSLNLTEYPQGALGAVFPLCIAGLHFANVQVRDNTLVEALIYKAYLQLLTLPILITTFCVPQGSLIYWFTNSTFSLIQLLCLHNPNLLRYLGLPEMNASAVAPTVIQRDSSVAADTLIRTKEGEISAQILSPEDLVSLSVEILGGGQKHAAIALLRVALDKDPGNVRALLILGQTLLQKEHYAEASEFLEKAISKLLFTGNPTEVGEVDLLILSSQWAGIANMLQGKMEEGFVHLERIAQMNEPQDSNSKAHYYDGLIILSTALANVNRRAEALHYLHKAAAYNPAFNGYIEQLEVDARGFASHLSDSKRYL
ncbi:hypothetical protein SASPL_109953 [Salvia splendens]|uniref:YidC/Oxa1 family membrane protein insertase n=1 Tax=Salvia splendens TaxID=180675 RepID=A0A8X8Y6F5_SALSN|nr:hypothetical protein SASPL_109953 [Salvia splendens]